MTATFADPHICNQNEGYEYVRCSQFERGERTDDTPVCHALYEVTEQRHRRLKDMDSATDTRPIQEAEA